MIQSNYFLALICFWICFAGCGEEEICIQNPYSYTDVVWTEEQRLDTLIDQNTFRVEIFSGEEEYDGSFYPRYDSILLLRKNSMEWDTTAIVQLDMELYEGYCFLDMNEDWQDDLVFRFYAGAKGYTRDYIFLYNSKTKTYNFLGEDYLEYYGSWHEPQRLCLKSNYYHSLDYDISDDSYSAYLWKIEDNSYYPLGELEYYPPQHQEKAYVYKTPKGKKRQLVDSIIMTPSDDLIEYSRELAAQYWNNNVALFDE